MGHSRFEITEAEVRFDTGRLRALVDKARELGYLEDFDPESIGDTDPPGIEALHSLFGEFFPCNYDLDYWQHTGDLVLSNPAFEWYDGDSFATGALVAILETAALPGSSLIVLDFDDYTRDIYEIVFDGEGGHRRVDHVTDGVPVRRAS